MICPEKRAYKSKKEALQTIHHEESEGHAEYGLLRAYECNECGFYHLTHQPQ